MPRKYTHDFFVAQFWPKVDFDGPIPEGRPELGPCWLWNGSHTPLGYGQVGRNRKKAYSHRVSYELIHGFIPEGKELDHLCRNTGCLNIFHLEAVTHRTNILRGVGLIPAEAAQTHCKRGHLFDEAATYIRPAGNRMCRICANSLRAGKRDSEYWRNYYAKNATRIQANRRIREGAVPRGE